MGGKQKNAPGDKCRWPQKATKAFLDLLRNAEANAEDQHLTKTNLTVKHVSCQRARSHQRIHGPSRAHRDCVHGGRRGCTKSKFRGCWWKVDAEAESQKLRLKRARRRNKAHG